MRIDEMSEHLQWLGLLMIEALPETLKRLKTRAVNAIHDGQNRLKSFRKIHHKMDLSDAFLADQYSNITTATILPRHSWDVEYIRYILELKFCTDFLLREGIPLSAVDSFTKRRHKVLTLVKQIEADHQIDTRWDINSAEKVELKREAVKVFIDSLVDELRKATSKELYARDALYDHGHSKHGAFSFVLG